MRTDVLWRGVRFVLWLGLALAVVAGLLAMAAALTAPEWMGNVNIVIDHERFDLSALPERHLFSLGLVLALVLLVIIPLGLLLGLGIPLLLLFTAALVLLSVVALIASPLLALGALLWWLFRPRAAAPPTIEA
jgi:hypothetical protein